MNTRIPTIVAVLFIAGLSSSLAISAEEPAAAASPVGVTALPPAGNLASQYTEKGADTCIKCHDEESEFPVFSIFKTRHAQKADPRAPFAGAQCEACHGPGAEHAKKVPEGQRQAPIIKYGANSPVSAEKQNKVCLECHQGGSHIAWQASTHAGSNIACASCHKIHAAHDPVLAKTTQPEVCYGCHKKARADFFKPSTHPLRSGQMACSECHNPHGNNTTAVLNKPTVNQTCYSCHAEKRGPFLWEHAPVSEDCTTCHTAHGSVHRALLVKNAPLLCQQCHSVNGHPAVARTGAALPGGGFPASGFLLAGSCTNCHSQVHGSNHPSGSKLMR